MIGRVGILSTITGRDRARTGTLTAVTAAAPPAFVVDPSAYPIASPWSSSTMQRILFEDIFGSEIPVNTRSAAMRIPAVASARTQIVSAVSRLPLVQLARGEQLPLIEDLAAWQALWDANPTWLYRSDDGTSPQHKMLWTVDDLIFYGWSCWWRRNGSDGFPISTGRVNMGDWSINADNRVELYGSLVNDNDVILFQGPHEGILEFGREAIGDARALYGIVRQRLGSPVPPIDLHQTGGPPLTETEIDTLIQRWIKARNDPNNGGVGYSNESIEVKPLAGTDDAQLMIEARNAAAVDMARLVGVPAGMIDATAPKASLNYENQAGRNQEFVDLYLRAYTGPIEWRLSMDDVSPRGKRVAFDFSSYTTMTPPATGPAAQD